MIKKKIAYCLQRQTQATRLKRKKTYRRFETKRTNSTIAWENATKWKWEEIKLGLSCVHFQWKNKHAVQHLFSLGFVEAGSRNQFTNQISVLAISLHYTLHLFTIFLCVWLKLWLNWDGWNSEFRIIFYVLLLLFNRSILIVHSHIFGLHMNIRYVFASSIQISCSLFDWHFYNIKKKKKKYRFYREKRKLKSQSNDFSVWQFGEFDHI